MDREEWFERYATRLREYCPEPDLMWDMEHLGPYTEDSEVEFLIAACPDDPERAAGVIYDQVIETMEMRGEVYPPPGQTSITAPVWKTWLARLLPAAIREKW